MVAAEDIFPTEVVLEPLSFVNDEVEEYSLYTPKLSVTNLLGTEKRIDPIGTVKITNKATGDTCELTYKPKVGGKGWFGAAQEVQEDVVQGSIRNSQG